MKILGLLQYGRKILSAVMACVFALSATGVSSAMPSAPLPVQAPGSFAPVLIQGVSVHPDNAMLLDFIVDPGQEKLDREALASESTRLVKYFMAALAVPEDDLWVNLSPYEKDRIVPEALGQTDLGRDMLAQDYLLKQVTASLMNPQGETGRTFWARVYARAQEKFGTIDIPVDTFNKVWIMPAKAVVYQNKGKAVVLEARLKVMLDADYLAAQNAAPGEVSDTLGLAQDVIREIVLPVLEDEVNIGKNFAPLRQIYHALILAHWYRNNLKASILNKVYADKKRIRGIDLDDKQVAQKIWAGYVASFKKGVYNFIQEERDPVSGESVPRKYFSGGEKFDHASLASVLTVTTDAAEGRKFAAVAGPLRMTVALKPLTDSAEGPDDSWVAEALKSMSTAWPGALPDLLRKFGTAGSRDQGGVLYFGGFSDNLQKDLQLLMKKFPFKKIYIGEQHPLFYQDLVEAWGGLNEDLKSRVVLLPLSADPEKMLAGIKVDAVFVDSYVDFSFWLLGKDAFMDLYHQLGRVLARGGRFMTNVIGHDKDLADALGQGGVKFLSKSRDGISMFVKDADHAMSEGRFLSRNIFGFNVVNQAYYEKVVAAANALLAKNGQGITLEQVSGLRSPYALTCRISKNGVGAGRISLVPKASGDLVVDEVHIVKFTRQGIARQVYTALNTALGSSGEGVVRSRRWPSFHITYDDQQGKHVAAGRELWQSMVRDGLARAYFFGYAMRPAAQRPEDVVVMDKVPSVEKGAGAWAGGALRIARRLVVTSMFFTGSLMTLWAQAPYSSDVQIPDSLLNPDEISVPLIEKLAAWKGIPVVIVHDTLQKAGGYTENNQMAVLGRNQQGRLVLPGSTNERRVSYGLQKGVKGMKRAFRKAHDGRAIELLDQIIEEIRYYSPRVYVFENVLSGRMTRADGQAVLDNIRERQERWDREAVSRADTVIVPKRKDSGRLARPVIFINKAYNPDEELLLYMHEYFHASVTHELLYQGFALDFRGPIEFPVYPRIDIVNASVDQIKVMLDGERDAIERSQDRRIDEVYTWILNHFFITPAGRQRIDALWERAGGKAKDQALMVMRVQILIKEFVEQHLVRNPGAMAAFNDVLTSFSVPAIPLKYIERLRSGAMPQVVPLERDRKKSDNAERMVDLDDFEPAPGPVQSKAGQSRIYFSKDGKQVLKIFKPYLHVYNTSRYAAVKEAHVIKLVELIEQLRDLVAGPYSRQAHKIRVVAPRLVRTTAGELGLLSERVMGDEVAEGIKAPDLKGRDLRDVVRTRKFVKLVDRLTGGLEDFRASDRANFLEQDGTGDIYNIDPLDISKLMQRMAFVKARQALNRLRGIDVQVPLLNAPPRLSLQDVADLGTALEDPRLSQEAADALKEVYVFEDKPAMSRAAVDALKAAWEKGQLDPLWVLKEFVPLAVEELESGKDLHMAYSALLMATRAPVVDPGIFDVVRRYIPQMEHMLKAGAGLKVVRDMMLQVLVQSKEVVPEAARILADDQARVKTTLDNSEFSTEKFLAKPGSLVRSGLLSNQSILESLEDLGITTLTVQTAKARMTSSLMPITMLLTSGKREAYTSIGFLLNGHRQSIFEFLVREDNVVDEIEFLLNNTGYEFLDDDEKFRVVEKDLGNILLGILHQKAPPGTRMRMSIAHGPTLKFMGDKARFRLEGEKIFAKIYDDVGGNGEYEIVDDSVEDGVLGPGQMRLGEFLTYSPSGAAYARAGLGNIQFVLKDLQARTYQSELGEDQRYEDVELARGIEALRLWVREIGVEPARKRIYFETVNLPVGGSRASRRDDIPRLAAVYDGMSLDRAEASAQVFDDLEHMVDGLTVNIPLLLVEEREGDRETARRIIDVVRGLYDQMGLTTENYHNMAHNLGTVFTALLSASARMEEEGFSARDMKLLFLGALLHDLHLRATDPGAPASVAETLRQLKDILGLASPDGLPREPDYGRLIGQDKGPLKKLLEDFIGPDGFEGAWAEIEAIILRTDYAPDMAPIEARYNDFLDRMIPAQRREALNRLALTVRWADMTSFYTLLAPQELAARVVPGLSKEGVMASVDGSYLFFFKPVFLTGPSLPTLDFIRTLPLVYRKNFCDVMEYFVQRGVQGAQADWEGRKAQVYAAVNVDLAELKAPADVAAGWKDFVVGDIVSDPAWENDQDYQLFARPEMGGGSGRFLDLLAEMKDVLDLQDNKVRDGGAGLVVGFGNAASELVFLKEQFGLQIIHGIDFVGSRVRSGAEFLARQGYAPQDFRLYQKDMRDIQGVVKDGSVDLIVAVNVTMLQTDETEAFAEGIVRLLAPGGKAMIGTAFEDKFRTYLEKHGKILWEIDNGLIFEKSGQDDAELGGIDLKAGSMYLETRGDNAEFRLPEAWRGIDMDHVEGLKPVVINMTLIQDMAAYLGLN